MHVFDAAQVHALLDYPSLIGALRAAHANGTMPLTSSQILGEPPGEENKFVSLIAWAAGEAIAVKLVGVFPHNLALPTPEPSVQGLVALFRGATGTPVLVADGAAMTFRKTAADSGLGASFLARKDASTLLMVGAGGLAPHVIMAHTAARPSIRRVLIWNRTPARAQAVAATVTLPGVSVTATADLDAAVAQADVISCATMATEPLIRGALLRPGTHVDLIGAYLPDMREADDDVVMRARVFVDTRENCAGSGDIATPIARGLLTLDQIEADLFELCTGRHPGRTDDADITMYKNAGGSHLDLFTTRHLLAQASAREHR
jgi:ornithine cyclodeaminase